MPAVASSVCHLVNPSSKACINDDSLVYFVFSRCKERAKAQAEAEAEAGRGRGTHNKRFAPLSNEAFCEARLPRICHPSPFVHVFSRAVSNARTNASSLVDRFLFSLAGTTVDFGSTLRPSHADTGDPAIPTVGILALLLRHRQHQVLREIPRLNFLIKSNGSKSSAVDAAGEPTTIRVRTRFCQPRGTLTEPANPGPKNQSN